MSAAAAMMASNLAPGGETGDKAKSIVLILVVITVIVIVFIIVKKGTNLFDSITGGIDTMLEKVGLKKSADEKAVDEAAKAADQIATVTNSPFNPTFYKTAPGGTALITSSKAQSLANQIWDSVGYFSDDPEAGFAAIKQCTSWAQVSFLADRFNSLFGRDLYGWLKIKYDTTAQKDVLNKIVAYATSLKKY